MAQCILYHADHEVQTSASSVWLQSLRETPCRVTNPSLLRREKDFSQKRPWRRLWGEKASCRQFQTSLWAERRRTLVYLRRDYRSYWSTRCWKALAYLRWERDTSCSWTERVWSEYTGVNSRRRVPSSITRVAARDPSFLAGRKSASRVTVITTRCSPGSCKKANSGFFSRSTDTFRVSWVSLQSMKGKRVFSCWTVIRVARDYPLILKDWSSRLWWKESPKALLLNRTAANWVLRKVRSAERRIWSWIWVQLGARAETVRPVVSSTAATLLSSMPRSSGPCTRQVRYWLWSRLSRMLMSPSCRARRCTPGYTSTRLLRQNCTRFCRLQWLTLPIWVSRCSMNSSWKPFSVTTSATLGLGVGWQRPSWVRENWMLKKCSPWQRSSLPQRRKQPQSRVRYFPGWESRVKSVAQSRVTLVQFRQNMSLRYRTRLELLCSCRVSRARE